MAPSNFVSTTISCCRTFPWSFMQCWPHPHYPQCTETFHPHLFYLYVHFLYTFIFYLCIRNHFVVYCFLVCFMRPMHFISMQFLRLLHFRRSVIISYSVSYNRLLNFMLINSIWRYEDMFIIKLSLKLLTILL